MISGPKTRKKYLKSTKKSENGQNMHHCLLFRSPLYLHLKHQSETYFELNALRFLPLKKNPSKTVMAFCLSSSLAKLTKMYRAPLPHCLKRWGFKPSPCKSFFAYNYLTWSKSRWNYIRDYHCAKFSYILINWTLYHMGFIGYRTT